MLEAAGFRVLLPDRPVCCGRPLYDYGMLLHALRAGTPNRNRIALQMVKDVLDESTFEASPGHVVPGPVGKAFSGLAGRLRDRPDGEHPG